MKAIEIGDWVESTPDSPEMFSGYVIDEYVTMDDLFFTLDDGIKAPAKYCKKQSKDSCEKQENSKDSCNITITDLIETAPQYNGHAQLTLERIRLDQLRPLMRELEEAYCTSGGRGIDATICEDGSGSIVCDHYWPEGNVLGHTSRTLISWDELGGW